MTFWQQLAGKYLQEVRHRMSVGLLASWRLNAIPVTAQEFSIEFSMEFLGQQIWSEKAGAKKMAPRWQLEGKKPPSWWRGDVRMVASCWRLAATLPASSWHFCRI